MKPAKVQKIIVAFGLLVLFTAGGDMVRGARPDEKMLEAHRQRRLRIQMERKSAHVWHDALCECFNRKIVMGYQKDSAAQMIKSLCDYTFLVSYKHYLSGSIDSASVDKKAEEFAVTWMRLLKKCNDNKLDPVLLAEAIYQISNSDWEPVVCARNSNAKDDVTDASRFEAFGTAFIRLSGRAILAEKDYQQLWKLIPRSCKIGTPEEIDRVNVLSPPQPPKW